MINKIVNEFIHINFYASTYLYFHSLGNDKNDERNLEKIF